MNSVYIGLAAFVYAAFVVCILKLFRCTDYDDLDDEGGLK
jgi:hypothetical protein